MPGSWGIGEVIYVRCYIRCGFYFPPVECFCGVRMRVSSTHWFVVVVVVVVVGGVVL